MPRTEADEARLQAQRKKARPLFLKVCNEPRVWEAWKLALRNKQRRLIHIILAVDGTGDELKVMQASIVSKPLPPHRD